MIPLHDVQVYEQLPKEILDKIENYELCEVYDLNEFRWTYRRVGAKYVIAFHGPAYFTSYVGSTTIQDPRLFVASGHRIHEVIETIDQRWTDDIYDNLNEIAMIPIRASN